ncbi:hypothetical protein Peetri_00062 [Pseudomonas phage vB_PpuM-Peetri]
MTTPDTNQTTADIEAVLVQLERGTNADGQPVHYFLTYRGKDVPVSDREVRTTANIKHAFRFNTEEEANAAIQSEGFQQLVSKINRSGPGVTKVTTPKMSIRYALLPE